MASLKEIRDAVIATLDEAIPELTGYRCPPDAPNMPAYFVQLKEGDFFAAMGRGTDRYEFDLVVMVGWTDSELSQDELDLYVCGSGAQSIRQAIFLNRTLGRDDLDASISALAEYGVKSAASVDHIGAVLRMSILTKGTA